MASSPQKKTSRTSNGNSPGSSNGASNSTPKKTTVIKKKSTPQRNNLKSKSSVTEGEELNNGFASEELLAKVSKLVDQNLTLEEFTQQLADNQQKMLDQLEQKDNRSANLSTDKIGKLDRHVEKLNKRIESLETSLADAISTLQDHQLVETDSKVRSSLLERLKSIDEKIESRDENSPGVDSRIDDLFEQFWAHNKLIASSLDHQSKLIKDHTRALGEQKTDFELDSKRIMEQLDSAVESVAQEMHDQLAQTSDELQKDLSQLNDSFSSANQQAASKIDDLDPKFEAIEKSLNEKLHDTFDNLETKVSDKILTDLIECNAELSDSFAKEINEKLEPLTQEFDKKFNELNDSLDLQKQFSEVEKKTSDKLAANLKNGLAELQEEIKSNANNTFEGAMDGEQTKALGADLAKSLEANLIDQLTQSVEEQVSKKLGSLKQGKNGQGSAGVPKSIEKSVKQLGERIEQNDLRTEKMEKSLTESFQFLMEQSEQLCNSVETLGKKEVITVSADSESGIESQSSEIQERLSKLEQMMTSTAELMMQQHQNQLNATTRIVEIIEERIDNLPPDEDQSDSDSSWEGRKAEVLRKYGLEMESDQTLDELDETELDESDTKSNPEPEKSAEDQIENEDLPEDIIELRKKLEGKLRKAEIEISIERAKIARMTTELEIKNAEFEAKLKEFSEKEGSSREKNKKRGKKDKNRLLNRLGRILPAQKTNGDKSSDDSE